ncbi:MAG: alpha/beta fold hydrolase, partial [Acidimicrobiales bacterium]
CGGAALLLAEEERPGTFSGLYCYEPIVPPTPGPMTPAPDNPLALAARRRRSTFEDRQAAFDNYSAKAPLGVIDPEVLWDYVEYGLADTPDGKVTLKCRREIEAAVYENAYSHGAYDRLALIHIPVTVAAGSDTEETTGSMARTAAAKLGRGPGEILAGLGHFGPLQDPARVAVSVLSALAPNTPG